MRNIEERYHWPGTRTDTFQALMPAVARLKAEAMQTGWNQKEPYCWLESKALAAAVLVEVRTTRSEERRAKSSSSSVLIGRIRHSCAFWWWLWPLSRVEFQVVLAPIDPHYPPFD